MRSVSMPCGVFAAVILAGVASGCAGRSERPETATDIVGPVWVAEDVTAAGIIHESRVTLELGTDGRASGQGGCNSYGSSYALDSATLRFGPLAATKMGCAEALMDQEQRYFDVLAAVERYAVTADGVLVLTTPDGREIRFRRE